MADKDNKTKEIDDSEETASKQPVTIKKVIIIMSVVFTVILTITVVTLVLILKKPVPKVALTTKAAQVEQKAAKEANKQVDSQENSVATSANQQATEPKNPALFYTIKPVFIVNLNSKKVKFLQISVEVMTRKAEVINSLTNNLPLIKNELLILFSNKSYDEVKSLEGREALRREALTVIKNVLAKETGATNVAVEDVLFTGFVVQ